MDQQQQARRRKRVLRTAGIVAALAFSITVFGGYLFGWKWTGLPKQTFWDWLDILLVPLVLAIGGYLFTRSENRATQAAAERRALDDILQAYLDGMAQLLTDKERPLHQAQRGDNLSTVARARTLTVLSRLDGYRKRNVLEFLYESDLIDQEQALLDESNRIEKHHNIIRLHQADLIEARLAAVNLSGALLREAVLIGADLRRADLSEADLSWTVLRGAVLIRADLSGADLSVAFLNNADLTLANLSGVNLSQAVLSNADLTLANLKEANLSVADLREANLAVADLKGALLRGAALTKAVLREADLSDANLRWVNLREANLRKANLSVADLTRADLTGADLSDANLSKANLFHANLSKARLSGVSEVTEPQLQEAISLEGATMPNGQKYENWIKSKGRAEDGKNDGSS